MNCSSTKVWTAKQPRIPPLPERHIYSSALARSIKQPAQKGRGVGGQFLVKMTLVDLCLVGKWDATQQRKSLQTINTLTERVRQTFGLRRLLLFVNLIHAGFYRSLPFWNWPMARAISRRISAFRVA
jgi:hypothetical protein